MCCPLLIEKGKKSEKIQEKKSFSLCKMSSATHVDYSKFVELKKIQIGAKEESKIKINTIALNPKKNTIVTGADSGKVRIWDANSGDPLRSIEGHTDDVTAVAFSEDGTKIVSGSWDNTVRIFNAETGEQLHVCEGHEDGVSTVAFSQDGTKIAYGTSEPSGLVRVFDAETGKELKEMSPHDGHGVLALAFNPNGTNIAVGTDENLIILNADTGKSVFSEHGKKTNSVAWSADGTTIVGGSENGFVGIFDPETGEVLQSCKGHGDEDVTSVAFSPDGTKIVSGSLDNFVFIWDAETGKAVNKFFIFPQIRLVAWSPDGTQVAIVRGDVAKRDANKILNPLVCIWGQEDMRSLQGEQLLISKLFDLLRARDFHAATHLWNANPQFNDWVTDRHHNFPALIFSKNLMASSLLPVYWLLAHGLDPFQPIKLRESDQEFLQRATAEYRAKGFKEEEISHQVQQDLGEALSGENLYSMNKDYSFWRTLFLENYLIWYVTNFWTQLQLFLVELIQTKDKTDLARICKDVKNKVAWKMEEYIGERAINVPMMNFELLSVIKSAVYTTIDNLKTICEAGDPLETQHLIDMTQANCFDPTNDSENRIAVQLHFSGYPKRSDMCVTLNHLLLSAYEGTKGIFGEWFETDIPKVDSSFFPYVTKHSTSRLARWTREKAKNAVLPMGQNAKPGEDTFIEFEVKLSDVENQRFSIHYQSWLYVMESIFKLVARGAKTIHLCLFLIGYWRSGNLVGTAFMSEIHAQTETSLKPVYWATVCVPPSTSAPPWKLPPAMSGLPPLPSQFLPRPKREREDEEAFNEPQSAALAKKRGREDDEASSIGEPQAAVEKKRLRDEPDEPDVVRDRNDDALPIQPDVAKKRGRDDYDDKLMELDRQLKEVLNQLQMAFRSGDPNQIRTLSRQKAVIQKDIEITNAEKNNDDVLSKKLKQEKDFLVNPQ